MIKCKRCDEPIWDDNNFCPSCGEDQRPNTMNSDKANATFLIVLCVLTIIGSVFTIARAYLYEIISMMDGDSNYIRGWIYAGSAIGTLVGAIMMIQRKLKGLYIYTVSQGIYIITVILATFSYGDAFDWENTLAQGIALFFLIPSITFLVLYWTQMTRKHLS